MGGGMDKKKILSAIRFIMSLAMVYFFTFSLIAAFSPSLLPNNSLYINAVIVGFFLLLIILMFVLGFDLRKDNIVLTDERDLELMKVAGYNSFFLTMMLALVLAMATAFNIVELTAPQSLLLVIVFGVASTELLRFYFRRKGKI